MNKLYYVWIGNTLRSRLFDYTEAVEYRNQLVNQGYNNVYMVEVV